MTAMLKNSLFALALVAAGAAAGVYSGSTRDKPESPPAPNRAVATPAVRAEAAAGADTYTTQMYDALAAILEQEVEERQRLEQELEDLQAIVSRLETALQTASTGLSEASARPRQNPRRNSGSRRGEGLQKRLVEQGLDEERAAYIARRRDELALERMYLQDQAAREGWANTPRFSEAWLGAQDRIALENELNAQEFDLYLRSTGQANRVTINNVLQTSPAEQAGFQPGDRLVSYDGQQIYSGAQLRAATRSGNAGDVVIVTVERGGQQMQLSIPRGPLGVNLGFAPSD
jgi:membrane-associated protease RseP (regulator of RpoE activity)